MDNLLKQLENALNNNIDDIDDIDDINIDEIDKEIKEDIEDIEDNIIEKIDMNVNENIDKEEKIKREIERELNKGKRIINKKEISKIMMTLLSSQEILNMSVVEITKDNLDNIDHGLYDRRLGTIDDTIICEQCKQDVMRCPGHFGHIKLYKKIIHPKYKDIVIKILNMFSDEVEENGKLKLLTTQDEIDKYENLSYLEKFKMIYEYGLKGDNRKSMKIYKMEKGKLIYLYRKEKIEITVEYIEELFEKIDKKDLEKIGIYTDIRNLIIEYIPVLPINLRPYNIQNGKITHHDFTLIYKEIISANDTKDINKITHYYYNLIDNKESSGGCKNLNGKLYNSLKSTIDSKQGLLRGGIFGKRGDYSARTVLTPDPNLKVYEIGVPISMSEILTTQENVTRYNIEYIKKLYKDNKIKFLIKKGKKINIHNNTMPKYMKFEPGDTIKRFIKNGDPIIFNRQPTLHKQSMIGLLIKLLPGSTFRINPAITTGLNADFDGDEGNLTVPQSQEAKIEASELMNIKNCVISEQTSKPITVLVQDVILGVYLLTNKDIIIDKSLFNDCLLNGNVSGRFNEMIKKIYNYNFNNYITNKEVDILIKELNKTKKEHINNNYYKYLNNKNINYDDKINYIYTLYINNPNIKNIINTLFKNINNINFYSGKILFSFLLPNDFNYIRHYNDNNIIIDNGLLISGYLNKDILSSQHGSIIDVLYRDYGKDITMDFMSNIQPLIHNWLKEYGFTIGYKDCLINDNIKSKIDTILDKTIKKTTINVTNDPYIDMKNEAEINQQLNNSRNLIAKNILQYNDNINIDLYDNLYTNMIIYYKNDNIDFNELNQFNDNDINKDDIINDDIKYFNNLKIIKLNNINNININIPKKHFIITTSDSNIINYSIDNISCIVLADRDKKSNKFLNTKSYLFDNEENPFKSMLISKSKGTNLNISQIAGSVGQQNISGQRIPFSITNNSRVLPHFNINDFSPSSRGFCKNSYLYGLDPLEFFFSSMGGREGLTDTAIKTSETGYLQRRITEFMRDLTSHTDGSIRNNDGNIIQFLYGNHGFSTDKMTKVNDLYTFTNIDQLILNINKKSYTSYSYIYNVFNTSLIAPFLVSLYSLILSNPKYDINIIFYDNIPHYVIDFISSLNSNFSFNINYIIVDLSYDNIFSIFYFSQYSKCLLIDNYIIFNNNIDDIFNLSCPSIPFNLPVDTINYDNFDFIYPFNNLKHFPKFINKSSFNNLNLSKSNLFNYPSLFLFDPKFNYDLLSFDKSFDINNIINLNNLILPIILQYYLNSNISIYNIDILYNYYVLYDPYYYQLSYLKSKTSQIKSYNFSPINNQNIFTLKSNNSYINNNLLIFNYFYKKLLNDYPESELLFDEFI